MIDCKSRAVHTDGVFLCNDCTGRWQISTASGSVYVLDLDERTQARVVAGSPMRRDEEAVRLVSLGLARLGWNLDLLLDLRGDGVHTWRSTNIVTDFEKLEGEEEEENEYS